MTGAALVLAAVAAIVDWSAVATRNKRLEYVAKPAVMVGLIVAALAGDAASDVVRTWFVIALVLSLAGDVFLMLEREQFVLGLSAFLLAHAAYIVGMLQAGLEPVAVGLGLAFAAMSIATIGRRIGGTVRRDHPRLAAPVGSYILVISLMVAAAIGTQNGWAIGGAILFYISDALLGWNRFVAKMRHGRLAVIVPYHLGQLLLVLALPTL